MSRRNLREGRLGSEGPDQTQTQPLTTSTVIWFQKENTGKFSCLVLFWVLKNGKLARKKGERKQSWGRESQKRKKEEGTEERRESCPRLSCDLLFYSAFVHFPGAFLHPSPQPHEVRRARRQSPGSPMTQQGEATSHSAGLVPVGCAPGSWLTCPLYKPLMTHCSPKSFRTSKTSSL